MNEREWLACTDPLSMVHFLRGKASDRKLRLFACACCRQVGYLATDVICLRAVEAAERHADKEVSDDTLERAWESVMPSRAERLSSLVYNATAPVSLIAGTFMSADWAAAYSVVSQLSGWVVASWAEERAAPVSLLRCLFGNPFRPMTLPSSVTTWNDGLVRRLAEQAYSRRLLPSGHLDPERLAVLADAMEEAGADAELVAHLRGPGPHVRGCFVVDCLTSKE